MAGWAIAVHGGAGVDPNLPTERQEEAKQLLTRCLNLGIDALRSSMSAIDVVELVVSLIPPSFFCNLRIRAAFDSIHFNICVYVCVFFMICFSYRLFRCACHVFEICSFQI